MEKYRRFDDPSCGINPFVPRIEKNRSAAVKVPRALLSVALFCIKVPFLLFLLFLLLAFNTLKYALIVPVLIRMFERIVNFIICKMLMSVFATNTVLATYHNDHKDFNFIKQEQGKLQVTDVIGAGDVIISNHVSLLEFLFLEMAYSPCFTAVCVDPETKRYGLRKLGMLEIPFFAMGIKFPLEVNEGDKKTFFGDILELRNSLYVKHRPVVIFPEGTKTNGQGILDFSEDITQMVAKAATKSKLRVHTIRFDYDFEYASPYNTTDLFGLLTTIKVLCQFRNVMLIQYYFNLEDKLAALPVVTPTPVLGGAGSSKLPVASQQEHPLTQYQFIRSTMMTRGKNYALKLTYREHQEFLGYWLNTQNKQYKAPNATPNKKVL